MPKQKRWAVKQKLNTTLFELDKVENKIAEVGVLYKEFHPDIYEKFSTVLAAVDSLKGTITFIRDTL